MAFLTALKSKLSLFNKKVEDYQEAITFSEAGMNTCTKQPKTTPCAGNTGRNLVVASHDNRFSDDMIDYALDMAKRMDYGIIAVNAANLTHDVTEFFSTTHEEIYKDFKKTSEMNVAEFRTKATDLGLKFAHTIKFSDIDHALNDITKECGEIEFVISENRESTRARGVNQNEKRLAQRLCVYSMN